MSLDIRVVQQDFVCEVAGLDLWKPLPAGAAEELRTLWANYGVVFFRRQVMSEAELIAFGRVFGEMECSVRTEWSSRSAPEISLISNLRDSQSRPIGGLGDGELQWHADQSYILNPATGAMLYAVELPASGGSTWWMNLYALYAELPEHIKRALRGRNGVFDYATRLGHYDEQDRQLTDEARARTPPVLHPLVQRHPASGRESLYVDPTTTAGIEGLPEAESRAVLQELREFADQPKFSYRHDWRVGDLIMWDNGVTLHRRDPFDAAALRLMKRTTLYLPRDRHIVPEGTMVAA